MAANATEERRHFAEAALRSFRPLMVFWAVMTGLMATTAMALQLAGPVTHAAPARAVFRAPLSTAWPAAVPPSVTHPAPALPLVSAAIPDPDPAMLEAAAGLPDRMLPRVAGDGRTPAMLYAAAFDPAERHPRVSIVIDGAGLDRALTRQAIDTLPLAVDLAFSAYAPAASAGELARAGRRAGRECLVSIPMEPTGFPDFEEGPRALSSAAIPAQNVQNLEWDLSNVAGCVGATGGSDGLNGERFAESNQAMAALLATLDRRGLLYLDPRSGTAPLLLPPGQAPPRVADVIVDRATAPDEPADAQAIDRNLAALEQDAARHGTAIGLAGPPRPVLLDRIAVWAHGLAARGIVLAPLTAIPPPRLPFSGEKLP